MKTYLIVYCRYSPARVLLCVLGRDGLDFCSNSRDMRPRNMLHRATRLPSGGRAGLSTAI
jgi:hypothetical protein